MCAIIASFQFKSRRNVILAQLTGVTLFTANMFMIGALMGGLLNGIAVIRALVYLKIDINSPCWLIYNSVNSQ